MGSGRYDNRVKRFNRAEIYEHLREDRGVKQIQQYLTQQIKTLSVKDRRELSNVKHTWQTGDRFWKLAARYYDNAEYWWIIGWYNQKPTENHVQAGDILIIPFPPDLLATLYSQIER